LGEFSGLSDLSWNHNSRKCIDDFLGEIKICAKIPALNLQKREKVRPCQFLTMGLLALKVSS